MPVPWSGCWLWLGVIDHKGYGTISINNRTVLAHRASFEAKHGPIDRGLCVLHRCDEPLCINPDHLFRGTQLDNLHDMMQKGRHRTMRGEKSCHAKLTTAQVLAIRSDARPVKIIAAEYGVSGHSIYEIKARRNWAHV